MEQYKYSGKTLIYIPQTKTNGSKDESRGRYHNTQQNKREDM